MDFIFVLDCATKFRLRITWWKLKCSVRRGLVHIQMSPHTSSGPLVDCAACSCCSHFDLHPKCYRLLWELFAGVFICCKGRREQSESDVEALATLVTALLVYYIFNLGEIGFKRKRIFDKNSINHQ